MKHHPISSIVVGIILTLGGLALILAAIFASSEAFWVFLIYGIPAFIVGVVMLLWKKEDEIEERKDMVKNKVKGGKSGNKK